MLRKILILLMSLSLCWSTVSCGDASTTSTTPTSNQTRPSFNNNNATVTEPIAISDGKYPVQQATYDDISGEYSLMLLNTPAGTPPILQTAQLQMARIAEEEATKGAKTYLQVENQQPVMYLTEDFKIEYVHNVTETRDDPQTGQTETVVIRRESSFWTPFAGAIAGQAIANILFRPHYYVPPIYTPGVVLTGYGGYGSSYSQAVNRYQERYKAPPAAIRNSRTFRSTRSVDSTGNSQTRRTVKNNSRATGSGVGSSTLRTSGKSSTSQIKRPSSFGSSGTRRPSRSFGSTRRRR
jgi:hypothetical protein